MQGEWYYAVGGQQQGPVTEAALREMLARGEIKSEDLVWRDGMAQWQPAGQVLPVTVQPSVQQAVGGGGPAGAGAGGPGLGAEWYYATGGRQQGPVSEAELRAMLGRGQVGAGDLVWREGMGQWQPAGAVLGVGMPAPAMVGGMGGLGYQVPTADDSTQKTLAILGIVLGAVGLVCCPLFIGGAGIACAAVAYSRNGPHKPLAKTALIVSIVCTVLGMGFGVLMFLR